MCKKNQYFSINCMLVAVISPVKFSKLVFSVWNFVQSLKFYFLQLLLLQLLKIRLSKRRLNSRKFKVYSIEILLNTATIRGKPNWNDLFSLGRFVFLLQTTCYSLENCSCIDLKITLLYARDYLKIWKHEFLRVSSHGL